VLGHLIEAALVEAPDRLLPAVADFAQGRLTLIHSASGALAPDVTAPGRQVGGGHRFLPRAVGRSRAGRGCPIVAHTLPGVAGPGAGHAGRAGFQARGWACSYEARNRWLDTCV